MLRVVKTRQARRDMASALAFLETHSPRAGQRLEAEIEAAIQRIAQFPESGRSRAEFRPGLRSVVVGDYLLFYRLLDQDVQVLRFLHGARDLPKLFGLDD